MADNVHFLHDKVDEVGLCFFETQSCLAYTPNDLPQEGAAGTLRFHVHLPLDLSWPIPSDNACAASETARTAHAVFRKAAFLHPRCAVLHPPAGETARQQEMLAIFASAWRTMDDTPLLLENTPYASVADLGEAFLQEMQLGFCLDTGHLLAYNQWDILDAPLVGQTQLVHWSAPGTILPHRHLPLTALTLEQKGIFSKLAKRLPPSCVHMLEIFSWDGIVASLPVLEQILDSSKP